MTGSGANPRVRCAAPKVTMRGGQEHACLRRELDGAHRVRLRPPDAEQGNRGQQHHRGGMRGQGETERRPERDVEEPVVDERDPGGGDQGTHGGDAEQSPDVRDVDDPPADVLPDEDRHDDRLGQVRQPQEGRDQDRTARGQVGEREGEEQEREDLRPVAPRREQHRDHPDPGGRPPGGRAPGALPDLEGPGSGQVRRHHEGADDHPVGGERLADSPADCSPCGAVLRGFRPAHDTDASDLRRCAHAKVTS